MQEVEKVVNSIKSMYDIHKDDITIMTHLGQGLTGNLLRIYTNRKKYLLHRILYFFVDLFSPNWEKKKIFLYEIIKYFFVG